MGKNDVAAGMVVSGGLRRLMRMVGDGAGAGSPWPRCRGAFRSHGDELVADPVPIGDPPAI
ncbi:hypothetical protein SPHINGOAX6_70277 [Sphingomonas sp. AX6]|nr:hypothetical protein SPHINGOAX6_70277 [Sphingomonas sp. AX6]